MKAIKTKYFGPGNVRGSRYKADDGDGNSVTLHRDDALTAEGCHQAACKALAEKMGWPGTYTGAYYKGAYYWVTPDKTMEVKV